MKANASNSTLTHPNLNRTGVKRAPAIGSLPLMKTRLTMVKHLVVLCGLLATTVVFAQTTYTWTGGGDGISLANATNWDLNGLPSGASQDTAQWDGKTTTNLVITYGSTSLPSTGFGSMGINFALTANQTNSVQFLSSVAQSAAVGVFGVTNSSAAAALIFGDTNIANLFNIVGRPAGAVHDWFNSSTTPIAINGSVRWQAGGGSAYTLDFSGPGDFTVNNYLRNDNGSGGTTVNVEGPGALNWTATGYLGRDAINAVNINGGKLVLNSSGLLANQPIANNATLVFDAASQSQALGGIISGSGLLQVNNGTLTLSGQNTYTGNTVLNGGELVVNRAEDAGTSGPLGIGGTISFNGGTLAFSANNVFDYSSRFSTNASQAYSFDTAGQNVAFTNVTGLTSSGGTLTKLGPGTLTLSGANTYDGLTTVSAGTLEIQGTKTGSGNITVANSAVLSITAGGAQVTPGTLTLGTSAGATLQFNGINSTTTAPLAAGTVSATAPVTIKINSGTITVGQSYPLLTWTSGSAPAVNLGVLNGYTGTLSTNGSTIQVAITGTSYTWTGANSGNWDTNTANNWIQNGAPAVFGDGGPVLFDDTSSATNVTVASLVQPSAVTVNSSSKTYSIASSGGNNIGGTGGVTKSGSGTLTLSGGANTYTGATTISGGTLKVAALANGSSASDVGAGSSSSANLVLDGGTLLYTGSGGTIDRLFTLGTGGGTIDSSGSGALVFNSGGSLGYNGNAPRAFTLTGSETDNNTLAANIADNGGATTLTKNGAGKWVLTGTNTHSGGTTISAGTLQVGAGGASGSLGSGTIVNNSSLDFNRTGSLTVSGAVNGTGGVTNGGSGTVILVGNNGYTGGTTISAGTLQIGNGGATGALDANAGVTNNGTLIFNSTTPLSLNGVISGTGGLIKQGSGLLKLLGNETYTGPTTVASGAQLQVSSGNQGALASPVVTNNGALIFVRQDNAVFIYSGNISGTGSLTEDVNNPNSGDSTLLGTNTYTGGTFIKGGGIILGDGATPGAGSIVGNVIFTNSLINDTARTLTFNHPEDYTFSGNIVGAVVLGQGGAVAANAGAVVHQGSGTLTLTGTNTYPAGTTINQGTLQIGAGSTNGTAGTGNIADNATLVFNRAGVLTIDGVISGTGSVVQQGTGTTILTATNTYAGSTTVSNGTLVVNGADSAVSTIVYGGALGGTGTLSGPVTLAAGTTLAPGGSVGTLTINSDLSIGGNVAIEVNKSLSPSSDLVVVSGVVTNTGSGIVTVTNLGSALSVGDKFTLFSKPVQNGASLTITGGNATWTNNLPVDGSISVVASATPTPPPLNFANSSTNLQFSWTGSFKLQSQTNSIASTNWVDYPGGGTSPVVVPIDKTKASVFFRLVSAP